jgi:hypothetical protein
MASIVFRHAARYGLRVATPPPGESRHLSLTAEDEGGGAGTAAGAAAAGGAAAGERARAAARAPETSLFHHRHFPGTAAKPQWEAMLDWYQAHLPGVPIVIVLRNPVERYARAKMGAKPTMLEDLGIQPTEAALEAFKRGAGARVFLFIPLDKFDEGLLTLARRLGWHPRDLPYLRINAKSPPAKPVHSPAEVRRVASLELSLYQWGAKLFDDVLASDWMGRSGDVAALRRHQQRLNDACWTPGVAPKVGGGPFFFSFLFISFHFLFIFFFFLSTIIEP